MTKSVELVMVAAYVDSMVAAAYIVAMAIAAYMAALTARVDVHSRTHTQSSKDHYQHKLDG